MSNESSRKEERREAARRELERRSRAYEDAARQNATNVDWGTGSTVLSTLLRENIIRLGALPQNPQFTNAVQILAREIIWPSDTFWSSTERFRAQHADFASVSEYEAQDAMPHNCHDLEFTAGSFYDGWEEDFTGVVAAALIPFAADSHYFFAIGPNSDDPTDPLIYIVDHETTDEEPYNKQGATVGSLLAVLARA